MFHTFNLLKAIKMFNLQFYADRRNLLIVQTISISTSRAYLDVFLWIISFYIITRFSVALSILALPPLDRCVKVEKTKNRLRWTL